MKLLQALSMDEIVYGKRYLFAELWYNHEFRFNLSTIEFCEKLPKDFIGERAMVVQNGTIKERYLVNLGLEPEKRIFFHRVLPLTIENIRVLAHHVFEEDALGFLMSLGYSENEALTEIRKKKNGPKSH
ncbi:MAG: hypothetical protein WCT49_04705 [Candidatus Paceibacterota bacterium]|nr:hypothetical protein [Candidatus Paceibacterota bacterium]